MTALDYEHKSIPRMVATLSVPTVLSLLVTILYNLADTYFVGLLNDPVQNAAVTLCAPLLLAFNSVANLFGVGASSMISRALGQEDYDTARKSAAFGFYGALAFSALYALACHGFETPLLKLLGADTITAEQTSLYMWWTVVLGAVPTIMGMVLSYLVRSEGDSFRASLGVGSGCVLNIFLDPVFVLPWGLNMGAEGAALATFLSNCVVCLYFAVILWRKRGSTCLTLHPKNLNVTRTIVVGIFTVGVSAAIQNLLNVTSIMILNNFAASYGTNAVAAVGIVQKVNNIPCYIMLGISQGISPLVGYTYARKDYPYMWNVIRFSMKLVLALSLVCSAVFLAMGRPVTGLFMANEEIITHGNALLRGCALGAPFLCIDFLSIGIFQAVGMGQTALAFAILRKVILEIPATILLNRAVGLYGLTFASAFSEIVLCITAIVILSRMKRRMMQTP